MRNTENDFVDVLVASATKGIELASYMTTLGTFCEPQTLGDFERILESYKIFQKAHIELINQRKVKSPAVCNKGKLFLHELEKFKSLPDLNDEKIQSVISKIQETTWSMIFSDEPMLPLCRTFEGICDLEDKIVQVFLRNTDTLLLIMALKDETKVQEKIFKNMSPIAAKKLQEDMEFIGSVGTSQKKKAQEELLKIINGLLEEKDC